MNKLFLIIILMVPITHLLGQNNTNSPYSIFAIGELNFTGGGRNVGMGQTGLALRSDLYLNSVNPASLTSIERKSFGFDLGMNMKFSNLENKYKSANVLNGNISWVQIGFPVLPFLSAGFSLNPKSNVGYSIYSTKPLEGTSSFYPVLYSGEGGLNEAAFSMGIKCFKNFSVGASSAVLWGNMNKQTTEYPIMISSYAISESSEIKYSGGFLKTGFQFYPNLSKKINFTLGGTAEFSSQLKSNSDLIILQGTTVMINETDNMDNMKLPSKFGIGMALGFNQKSTFTFDYNRSDWTDASVNLSSKSLNINQSFHFGAEISPKFDPGRYGQALKYRAGALYQTGYINVYGIPIDNYAVSLGMSLPIRRDRSTVNFSLEAGQQGTLDQFLIRESYIKLNLSLNLWERWFMRRTYN
jgi:hypothetical protein